jgi:fucose permease
LLVVVFAIVALEFALSFWLASYLADDVGLRRELAVTMVSGLYLANLLGRVVASRLAHRFNAELLLAGALVVVMLGLPLLLTAQNAVTAAVGLAIAGVGIAATFPLTSALHVATSRHGADAAMGQVLAVASAGQMFGPLVVAALAQFSDLRVGLLSLIGFTLLAAGALRWQVSRPS